MAVCSFGKGVQGCCRSLKTDQQIEDLLAEN